MNKYHSVFLTGSTGFVGSNIYKFLANKNFNIHSISRDDLCSFNFPSFNLSHSIIHLAGKAHDVRNISNPEEYYQINTELTKRLFDAFLNSDSKVFITLSSVKAVADVSQVELSEEQIPNPITHYGKSKLLAEEYILSRKIPKCKRVFILRPCLIHGPGNKGNLNLLYDLVSKGLPWPLGAFENKRSFCSIDNLMFVIIELLERMDIPSGVYNVADDDAVSTNDVISIISKSKDIKPKIWRIPIKVIKKISKIGDIFHLPLTTERLQKLTDSYVVNNQKLKIGLGKPFPISTRDGLLKTFQSFKI